MTRGSDSVSSSTTATTRTGRINVTGHTLPNGDSTVTITGTNVSPSATMQCSVFRGGTEVATTSFQTNASGIGSRDVPASEFTGTSGLRYAFVCDDGVAPSTPVRDAWTAP